MEHKVEISVEMSWWLNWSNQASQSAMVPLPGYMVTPMKWRHGSRTGIVISTSNPLTASGSTQVCECLVLWTVREALVQRFIYERKENR